MEERMHIQGPTQCQIIKVLLFNNLNKRLTLKCPLLIRWVFYF